MVAIHMLMILNWLLLIGAVSLIVFVAGWLVYTFSIEPTVEVYRKKGWAGAVGAFFQSLQYLTVALGVVWIVSVLWTSASDWPSASFRLDRWASILLEPIFKCAYGITVFLIVMAPWVPFYFLVARTWRTRFWIRIYRLNERIRGALALTVFALSMMGTMEVVSLPDWDLLALETEHLLFEAFGIELNILASSSVFLRTGGGGAGYYRGALLGPFNSCVTRPRLYPA